MGGWVFKHVAAVVLFFCGIQESCAELSEVCIWPGVLLAAIAVARDRKEIGITVTGGAAQVGVEVIHFHEFEAHAIDVLKRVGAAALKITQQIGYRFPIRGRGELTPWRMTNDSGDGGT